jgi:ABC-type uncharacterized transport system ATPase subunit
LFEIKYLSADFPDLCSLKDVSLSLKPGEILAVSGIRDEGLEQLERLFSGRISRFRGSAEFRGQPVDLAQPSALRKIGAGIVPSQRKRYGAALSAKAWENIGISMRDEDRQGFRRSPMSPRRRFKDRVLRRYEGLELNLDVPASSYSGGMLQQLIVNREISIGKELLILSNPGWGLDPQHRERIYELIRSSAAGGAAVLLISSELDEALGAGTPAGLHQRRQTVLPCRFCQGFPHCNRIGVPRAMGGGRTCVKPSSPFPFQSCSR